MNEENKIIDQSLLASDLSNKIHYEFREKFLVKPLDPIKVKKEFTKPVVNKGNAAPTKDENDVEAVDYENVETEVKEVDSDFRKGVVLKVPFNYATRVNDERYPEMKIEVGDIIIYRANYARYFDLLKDTQIVDPFNIEAVER